jgi:endonuclease/exonuclease/phosphatase family metal-dependent hydrolase
VAAPDLVLVPPPTLCSFLASDPLRVPVAILALVASVSACSNAPAPGRDGSTPPDSARPADLRLDLRPLDRTPEQDLLRVDAWRPDLGPPPPFRVRVLTYNLQWATGADYQALSTLLLQKAASNEAPDLVFLEEGFIDAGDDAAPYPVLKAQLGTLYPYQWHGPMAGSKPAPSGVVMLSRLPMLDQQSFAYTSSLPPDSFANKGLAWAKLKTPDGCPPLAALATHLQAGKTSDFGGLVDPALTRLDQTNELLAQLTLWQQGNGLPIVMGGDFNYFVGTSIAPDEGLPTGNNGYYTITHAFGSWLVNSEIACASSPSGCAAPGLPLSTQPYGMLKVFFGETASAGVKPVSLHKYAATDYGGLGDHEIFEVDYQITCR